MPVLKKRFALSFPIQIVLWATIVVMWVVCFALIDLAIFWLLLPASIVATGLALSCSIFTLKVDSTRITVSALLSYPKVSIRGDQLLHISTSQVDPLGDFLGWGFRKRGPRDYGFITRGGPAVAIESANGTRLTATVPDSDFVVDTIRSTFA
jgi:flagellar biosynthesis protein FliP